MDAINDFFTWLFTSRQGVLVLVLGGIVFFVLISIFLEIKTRQRFKNHKKQQGDWDLFDSNDESSWSDFEEDNK